MSDNSINDQLLNVVFVICKICKEEKTRIRDGMFPNGKDPRFIDKNGIQWNGRECPDCHKSKNKVRIKNRRHKIKAFREKVNAKRRERYKLTGK